MLMEEVKDVEISFGGRFASIVITRGEGIISTNVGDFKVKKGETYLLPASIDMHRYVATKSNLDIIISLPPIFSTI
jgi:mannose-6-phosphate isomerase class I